MNKRLIANVIGCACLTLATAAEARTSYDGPWNLTFVTQHGSCDPTYNFSVNINDGVVTHCFIRFEMDVDRNPWQTGTCCVPMARFLAPFWGRP